MLASSAIGQVDWSGPIVITLGGTYTGNCQSTQSKAPAVTVATIDPVKLLAGAVSVDPAF